MCSGLKKYVGARYVARLDSGGSDFGPLQLCPHGAGLNPNEEISSCAFCVRVSKRTKQRDTVPDSTRMSQMATDDVKDTLG